MAGKGALPLAPRAVERRHLCRQLRTTDGATDGGPFLRGAPGTKFYVIEYDSAGHVWVAPPGVFGPYNKGQDFALQPNICDAAVG